MQILGIIGARAGSKGYPGKNVRPLCGRPLLSWAVTTAKASRHINRVMLSTDSEVYAAVGREWGAETPFLRPAEYASDTSIEFEYIRHALLWLDEHEEYRPDLVVRVCPTAPLIRAEDIDACIEILLADPDAHSAIIMTPAKEHPRKTVKISPDGKHSVSYITEKGSHVAPTNRQSYPDAFNRQSLPIVSRRNTILELGNQTGEVVRYHIVPQHTALDIDTEFDFQIVDYLLSQESRKNLT
jgi:CMP-N,N'-diacetyllegionaminic acid synthase